MYVPGNWGDNDLATMITLHGGSICLNGHLTFWIGLVPPTFWWIDIDECSFAHKSDNLWRKGCADECIKRYGYV